jgi:RNA polymerase sigma-70 factor (ECF subfamily)
MQGLLGLLAEEVALWSDGGGKAVAALRPVRGADRVARFVVGSLRKLVPAERVSRLAEINGQPGIITYAGGRPLSAVILDVIEGRIRGIYIVSNPEKLVGLPPSSNLINNPVIQSLTSGDRPRKGEPRAASDAAFRSPRR